MKMSHQEEVISCSMVSATAAEQLFATAPTTQVYLLLEYSGAWQSKAFESSDLPQVVKDYLASSLERMPGSRLLLIRQPGRVAQSPIRFFLVRLTTNPPQVYRWELSKYDDLLELNLPEIASGEISLQDRLFSEVLYLVCAHGRRDLCCSRLGVPVNQKLQALSPANVWESSHVGGHRFAANLIVLPQGILYGRVDPEGAAAIVSDANREQLYLPRLRGRLSYHQPEQAADYFLRLETQDMGIGSFALVGSEETAPGRWVVSFADNLRRQRYHLGVMKEQTSTEVLENCGSEKKIRTQEYRLYSFDFSPDNDQTRQIPGLDANR
jgi:hypothetical protein